MKKQNCSSNHNTALESQLQSRDVIGWKVSTISGIRKHFCVQRRLPNDCQMTAWKLPDDCLTTSNGDVLKLFFWVSFYYIFKKTKAFHFKSKAFLFYSDKFPKNQKLFVLNQKLFFFLMTRFLQIKSFSFEIKSFSFSYSKIFRNQKLFFFNQISFFWWFLHHSHTFLTPWHISSPYCARINYCMRAIITCSWILTYTGRPRWIWARQGPWYCSVRPKPPFWFRHRYRNRNWKLAETFGRYRN